jgi:hypothetical protein
LCRCCNSPCSTASSSLCALSSSNGQRRQTYGPGAHPRMGHLCLTHCRTAALAQAGWAAWPGRDGPTPTAALDVYKKYVPGARAVWRLGLKRARGDAGCSPSATGSTTWTRWSGWKGRPCRVNRCWRWRSSWPTWWWLCAILRAGVRLYIACLCYKGVHERYRPWAARLAATALAAAAAGSSPPGGGQGPARWVASRASTLNCARSSACASYRGCRRRFTSASTASRHTGSTGPARASDVEGGGGVGGEGGASARGGASSGGGGGGTSAAGGGGGAWAWKRRWWWRSCACRRRTRAARSAATCMGLRDRSDGGNRAAGRTTLSTGAITGEYSRWPGRPGAGRCGDVSAGGAGGGEDEDEDDDAGQAPHPPAKGSRREAAAARRVRLGGMGTPGSALCRPSHTGTSGTELIGVTAGDGERDRERGRRRTRVELWCAGEGDRDDRDGGARGRAAAPDQLRVACIRRRSASSALTRRRCSAAASRRTSGSVPTRSRRGRLSARTAARRTGRGPLSSSSSSSTSTTAAAATAAAARGARRAGAQVGHSQSPAGTAASGGFRHVK